MEGGKWKQWDLPAREPQCRVQLERVEADGSWIVKGWRTSEPGKIVEQRLPEMKNYIALGTFVRSHLDLFDHFELAISQEPLNT
jgi:hypothetical protein